MASHADPTLTQMTDSLQTPAEAAGEIALRTATGADADAVCAVFEPAIRAGETYALPRDMSREEIADWVFDPAHAPFVAVDRGVIVGAGYYRANARGGGGHVANAAFATHPGARGRGVATRMCVHAISAARAAGFRAMQFNYVVAGNPALTLWQRHGFSIVGTLPGAFVHPALGEVDVHVMHRRL